MECWKGWPHNAVTRKATVSADIRGPLAVLLSRQSEPLYLVTRVGIILQEQSESTFSGYICEIQQAIEMCTVNSLIRPPFKVCGG